MKHKKIAIGTAVGLFAVILLVSAYIICTVRKVDFRYDASTPVTEGEMLAASQKINAYVGKSVFSVKADKIAASLEDNPYVKVVSVKVDFPAVLSVHVEERQECFAVEYGESYFVFGADNFVLAEKSENSARADGLPLPCISGDTVGFRVNSAASFEDGTDALLFNAAVAVLSKFGDARNELSGITVSRYDESRAEWNRIIVKTKEGATFVITEAVYLYEQKAELLKRVFDGLTGADRVERTVEIFTAENDTVDFE